MAPSGSGRANIAVGLRAGQGGPTAGRGREGVGLRCLLRCALGIRQDQLACQMDVDSSTLARWERGKGHPDANHEQILSKFLNQ